MNKTNRLQTYDILIIIAITSMIIDHIGHYFLPELESLRIIGRLAAPLFLFLAGYGNNHIKPTYVFWGFILTYCSGAYPLDILITFFLLSVTYHYILCKISDDFIVFALVAFFSIFTSHLQILLGTFIYHPYLAYIGIAFLYFMAGKTLYNKQLTYSLSYLSLGIFLQFLLYFLVFNQTYLLSAVFCLFLLLLLYFYKDIYGQQRLTTNPYLRLISQYSLQIYISHIILFFLLQQLIKLN